MFKKIFTKITNDKMFDFSLMGLCLFTLNIKTFLHYKEIKQRQNKYNLNKNIQNIQENK